jgi:hypothetical protein
VTTNYPGMPKINAGSLIDWPAPLPQIEAGRTFLRDCARFRWHVVLCPDKDADGLSSGLIVYRALLLLGLPEECLHLHFLSKGQSIHGDVERARLEATIRGLYPDAAEEQEAAVIIVDQASRPARPIVRSRSEEGCGSMVTVKTLIMDHHQATEWPEDAVYVTACRSSPICTSSLLVYLLCTPLHNEVPSTCAWLALVGIFGDLGPSEIKFGDESGVWPVTREMLVLKHEVKEQGKKSISDAVGMLNARGSTVAFCAIWADLFVRQARRTAEFNGRWLALYLVRRLSRTDCSLGCMGRLIQSQALREHPKQPDTRRLPLSSRPRGRAVYARGAKVLEGRPRRASAHQLGLPGAPCHRACRGPTRCTLTKCRQHGGQARSEAPRSSSASCAKTSGITPTLWSRPSPVASPASSGSCPRRSGRI